MVTVCAVPREQLENLNLAQFVEREGYEIPRSRLSAAAWSLENPQVEALMQKIRSVGVPLVDFAGTKPYYGIKTGFNEAFLIDDQTRQKLIAEDPKCSEIIKPYLRGRNICRWRSEREGEWLIFTRRGIDIQSYISVFNYLQNYREKLEPKPPNWNSKDKEWKGRKAGSYQWYEIQDSVDYFRLFEEPKIIYQVIQTLPLYSWDTSGTYSNDKTFILPNKDFYLLGVLNSPLIWAYSHRYFTRMLSGAISPMGYLFEQLPIAPPTEPIRREAEDLVSELIELTQANQEATREVMGWLAFEFNIDKPGQKLADFAQLSLDEFRAELKKRCPKGTAIGPKQVKAIDLAYADYATPIRQRNADILQREHRLSDLVNAAYQLTPDEIELLWKTAPPRMPIAPPNQPQ